MKKITLLFFMLTVSFGFSQAPTVDPPTPPARNAADVISVFSAEYTDIGSTNFNPNWGQSGFGVVDTAYEPTGAGGSGNVVLAYTNFNYQGIDFSGAAQNASGMEYLHVDVWTPNATDLKVTPINNGTGAAEVLVDVSTPITTGSWMSVDLPISAFTGMTWDSVFQLKFDGQGGLNPSDIYVDNIYFWKTPAAAGTDATLSDLQVDNVTVPGFNPAAVDYNVDLPAGTTVVPQITLATTTDVNATHVINQATAIPGDGTVVVTAQDGTTMQTYTVSFAITTPGVDAPTPPARDAADVISIFSDAYTNVPNVDYNPNWGQSGFGSANTAFEVTPGSGNFALEYPNFNYQGNDFNGAQNISTMEFLHVDVWTNDQSPNIYVISSGAEIPHALGNQPGSWTSIDIPVTGITGDLTSAIQFKFDGGTGGKIYLDNLYFWKTPTAAGTDASLSDLQVDNVTVAGFNPATLNYTVELPVGTTVVPQITSATTTDVNASQVTTQATGIPGDATVDVTAQDGTTTQTYTVSFAITTPGVNAPTPPARNASDVISIYSDAYANVPNVDYNPNWGQSGFSTANPNFEAEAGSGNTALEYPNFNYQGNDFNGAQDISGMDFLHLDIWTNDTSVNVYVISSGAEIAHPITSQPGTWQSVEIPIAGITGDPTSAIQFKFDGGSGARLMMNVDNKIYIDNLYFYKGVPLSTEEFNTVDFNIYPNPTKNNWNVKATQLVNTVEVYDVLGKSVLVKDVNSTEFVIETTNLNAGLYFAKLNSDNGSKTIKLIKE